MDSRQHHAGGGVKVTYIETQFVTSDAAGFKDLVQRLTGRSPTAAAAAAPAPAPAALHRPRACSAGAGSRTAAAGPAATQGYHYYQNPVGEVRCQAAVAASGAAPPCLQDDLLLGMDYEFSDLFYVGAAGEQRLHGVNGGYSDLLY